MRRGVLSLGTSHKCVPQAVWRVTRTQPRAALLSEAMCGSVRQMHASPTMAVSEYQPSAKAPTKTVVGEVEDIYLEENAVQGTYGTFWRHYYTVNGLTGVKLQTRDWLAHIPEMGIERGTMVAMTCTVNDRDEHLIQTIRPASPKEIASLVKTRAASDAEKRSLAHEFDIRRDMVFCLLRSKLAANLDCESYGKALRVVYDFVKDTKKPLPLTKSSVAAADDVEVAVLEVTSAEEGKKPRKKREAAASDSKAKAKKGAAAPVVDSAKEAGKEKKTAKKQAAAQQSSPAKKPAASGKQKKAKEATPAPKEKPAAKRAKRNAAS
ncbi:hypothetical protein DIPPA_07117 [Diplonema papillatum]|nr:hypothetical protein DIPPA_07117 [Diplonema papillatum]